jgi:hypothetical protein
LGVEAVVMGAATGAVTQPDTANATAMKAADLVARPRESDNGDISQLRVPDDLTRKALVKNYG